MTVSVPGLNRKYSSNNLNPVIRQFLFPLALSFTIAFNSSKASLKLLIPSSPISACISPSEVTTPFTSSSMSVVTSSTLDAACCNSFQHILRFAMTISLLISCSSVTILDNWNISRKSFLRISFPTSCDFE